MASLFQRRRTTSPSLSLRRIRSTTISTTPTTPTRNNNNDHNDQKVRVATPPRRIRSFSKDTLNDPMQYEQQLSRTNNKTNDSARGRITSTSAAAKDTKSKWSKSRSMSPFRFLQRDGKKKDHDAKKFGNKDKQEEKLPSSSSSSSSNLNHNKFQKRDKPRSLRSRSFSPFRSRQNGKPPHSLFRKSKNDAETKNEYHDESSSSSSTTSSTLSVRQNLSLNKQIATESKSLISKNDDERQVLAEGRNPTSDMDINRERTSLPSQRTKFHDGRPPTIGYHERYSTDRRGSQDSMSIINNMHRLEPSMSFESVMAYPPSKLISTSSRKKNTCLQENSSVKTGKEPTPSDYDDKESKTKVDDSTFSKYDNVLSELKNQTKYKKLWKRSFLKNDQGGGGGGVGVMKNVTKNTSMGALDNRPFLTPQQRPKQSVSRLLQDRSMINQQHHYYWYTSPPHDENLVPLGYVEETLNPPRIVETSEGSLGKKNQIHNCKKNNKNHHNQRHNASDSRRRHCHHYDHCHSRSRETKTPPLQQEGGDDHHHHHHCINIATTTNTTSAAIDATTTTITTTTAKSTTSTSTTNTTTTTSTTTTNRRYDHLPNTRVPCSPLLETIANAQQITQQQPLTTHEEASKTKSILSTEERPVLRSSRKSLDKKRKPKKKMSAVKSKSIRRLFNKPQSQDDRTIKQKEDRRRNFAFMKATPSGKNLSTAALERTRARSKQLADFAFNPGEQYQESDSHDFFSMYADDLDETLENQPFTSNGLNFAALDNESVISGYSSTVYDMDTFDESSVYSNRNTMRSGGRHSLQKDRLWNYNQSPRANHPPYSMDMFSASKGRGFEPSPSSRPVGSMNHQFSINSPNYPRSESGSSMLSFFEVPNSATRINHSTRSSAASVISTSSSVSGPASRRLMRRGMNIVRNQNVRSSNDSVASEGDGSQSFCKDESSEKGLSMRMQGNMDHGPRPSMSQSRDEGSNFGFNFNAFGLNEHEIDNDVNAAIAELVETNPDISMFMQTTQSQDIHSRKNEKAYPKRTGHSLTMEKEVSIASTLTKSSESENVNASTATRKVDDLSSHRMKTSEHPSNEINGNKHKETIRTVKERIKARQINSSVSLSVRKIFQPITLPDVGSSDSDDGKSKCDISENDEFETCFAPESHMRDKGSSLGNTRDDTQTYDEKKVGKSEQLTISSEETESSKEAIQFIPRKKNVSQHEMLSESQKRAQSWASERLDPIMISPLLVPKSGHPKKATTPSQKRAKEWANERSSDKNHFFQNLGDLKHEVHKETDLRRQTSRQESNSRAEIRVPSPEPTFVGEDESNYSFTSEDLEVQAINKGAQQIRKISEIGQRLPMPTEKVELRPTASPNYHPDYEKYKSTAPTVPLRKVQTNAQRVVKDEDTNFLANVKLRKVISPAPRVEHDKMTSPCDEDMTQRVDDCLLKKQLNRYDKEHGEQDHFITSRPYARPTDLDLEIMPSDEISDSNNCANTSKLSREVATKYRHDIRRTGSYDAVSPTVHNANRSQRSPIKKNGRDYVDESISQSGISEYSQSHDKEARSVSHPVAKLFAPNGREDTYDYAKEQREPKLATSQGKDHTTYFHAKEQRGHRSVASQGKGHMPSKTSVIESHVVNGVEGLHASIKEGKANTSFVAQSEDEGSSLHPVAQLFAARSNQLLSQKHTVSTETRTTTNRSTSSSASKESVDRVEHESEDSGIPSLDNVASLFAKRSALMSRSIRTESTVDRREKSNLSLAQERKQGNDEISNDSAMGSAENNDKPQNESYSNALKDDPTFEKYFKMLKMGFPMEVVKHALTRDGFDPAIIDTDHKKPAGSKDNTGIPLKEDPRYAKYFKMLKMGLPMGAVKNAMERDGEDPSIMDSDHNAPAHPTQKVKQEMVERQPKDNYRRTRVHWDTLGQVKSTSVWAMVNQDPDVEDIEIDESEFAELFQAELGQTIALDSHTSKKVNAVKVIDPKRANNGGIVLARLKITYEEMAVAIDTMNDKVMNVEQVQGILEYIPTKDEKQALRKYMNSSHKDSADAFDDLSECEKFMVAMMTVKHSKEKVRALLFKLQFRQCVSDLETDVSIVEKACDELKASVRLRKLLGIVLNIGNRLNTAGPTKKGKAGAFTIESLLKLNQAKAFDKKTTFLHYIVLIVMRHNESLTNFKDDLPSVMKADKIYWDQIENDVEEVENQLENVRKIALHEVFGKKKPSWARKKKKGDEDDFSEDSMSLEEEVEALRSTRIGIFTLQAIKIVSALREQVEGTRLKFRKLLEYFGEDERKKMSPHELFEIICIFAKDFSVAKEAVLNLEKEKAKRKRRNGSVRSHSPSDRSRDSSYSRCSKDKSSQSDRTSNTQQTKTPVKTAPILETKSSHYAHNVSSSTNRHNDDSMGYDVPYGIEGRESKRSPDSKFIANESPRGGVSSDSREFRANDRSQEGEVELIHHRTDGNTVSPSTPASVSTSDMENMHLYDEGGFTVSQPETYGKETKQKPPTPERNSSPRERIMSRREKLARRQRGGIRQSH